MGENLKSTGDRPDFHKYVRSEKAADIVFVDKAAESQANRPAWFVDEKTLASITVAEALPSLTIPKGYALVIIAKPNNTDEIYYGDTKAEAETKKHALKAGGSISLKITDSNLVFILPKVTNEGVDFFSESD